MSSFGDWCGVCKEPKVDGFCHCDAPERLRRPLSPEEENCPCCGETPVTIGFMRMFPEVKWADSYKLCRSHQVELAAVLLKMEAAR